VTITEVQITLVEDYRNRDDQNIPRVAAYASITFDDAFVVHGVKVLSARAGHIVAMPDRRHVAPCPVCGTNNYMRAQYCNYCGSKLARLDPPRTRGGKPVWHSDVAHPTTPAMRSQVNEAVLREYFAALRAVEV
jgi:DNA-binding cell septation regulator SpoVG